MNRKAIAFKLFKGFLFCLISFIIFLTADWFYPLNLTRYQDISVVITANQQPAHIFLTKDQKWRILTQAQELPSLYTQTLIEKEDKYYRKHFGINPIALGRAFLQWIRYGHIVSGGSTLTMQTARLLEPRSRTLLSKLIECFRALQLEWHYSKNEILNIYLTLAPLGSNIEGINAGALSYFNKSSSQLVPAEIALLVAMVQSPSRLQPNLYPDSAFKARNKVLSFMASQGLITKEQAKINMLLPIPTQKIKFPREIPHLAWRLKKQFPSTKISTTIDLNLQKQIEFMLQRYQPLLPQGANAAILVVDHLQNKPLVYIGSHDFFSEENHGYVDYIDAYRSPGSTLKPFIYALGFDLGLLTPGTYLLDERQRFGAYYPQNFDKQSYGVVSTQEALVRSLNIPVVSLLNQIGVIRFLGLLKEAEITPQFPASFDSPSLAVALGGVGLTLEQLVKLYAILARHGCDMPLSYLESNVMPSSTQVLSIKSSKEITDILKIRLEGNRQISLKTGTSYGHRDALVVGYNHRYVVGVWIGKPDGSSMDGVWASNVSVPLLKKVFNLLAQDASFSPNDLPALVLKNEPKTTIFKSAPSFLFPVNDTIIELEKEGEHFKSIPLSITGGKRPYTLLIDDKPFQDVFWQKPFWTPPSPGFYTLTVVDALGQVDKINIELR
ncbi:MAG: penicillin-binding protein 1C [Proteobacteria bacterium]|nr:penicillin-binding protein 1C [Pseudomonadota bacterium]